MTISVAASKARCERLPVPTSSAACRGNSSATMSPRQIFSLPIGWPLLTGAFTGPV
jgi:hypothetical protein